MKRNSFLARLGLCLVGALLAGTAQAQQVVLDFEDLTGFAPMPAGYGGIANWGSWAHSDFVDPNYPAYSGAVKILSVGLQQSIVFGQPYVFDGARVVSALPFSFELYYQGALVHTTAVIAPNPGGPAVWLPSGYSGLVDSMRYVSSVNVHGVDLFTYTIPTPPVLAYCTAGTTANGCTASISGTGTASASAGSGFTLTVSGVEGQQSGILFYGLSGPVAAPWGAGSSFMCVKSPLERTSVQNAGGTASACDGVLSIDWNAYVASTPTALGVPFAGGETVWAQGWFRDPPSPKTTSLSNGLQFVVQP